MPLYVRKYYWYLHHEKHYSVSSLAVRGLWCHAAASANGRPFMLKRLSLQVPFRLQVLTLLAGFLSLPILVGEYCLSDSAL